MIVQTVNTPTSHATGWLQRLLHAVGYSAAERQLQACVPLTRRQQLLLQQDMKRAAERARRETDRLAK